MPIDLNIFITNIVALFQTFIGSQFLILFYKNIINLIWMKK